MRRFLAEAKFQRHHSRLLRHRSVSRRLKALKRLMLDAKGVEASFYREEGPLFLPTQSLPIYEQ